VSSAAGRSEEGWIERWFNSKLIAATEEIEYSFDELFIIRPGGNFPEMALQNTKY
jgi:hypothetical protein